MNTKIIQARNPETISTAQEIIQQGGVIAFPTDTVYGVGVSAFNNQAILKLYDLKKRSKKKAIPILIAEPSEINHLAALRSPECQRLMDRFWPGPLTLVLQGKDTLPPALSPESTVGIRIPASSFTRELLRATGPLAATSANISGKPSARTAADVIEQIAQGIDLIIDGGKTPSKGSSTVVDCTTERLHILRQGPIPADELKEIWEDG